MFGKRLVCILLLFSLFLGPVFSQVTNSHYLTDEQLMQNMGWELGLLRIQYSGKTKLYEESKLKLQNYEVLMQEEKKLMQEEKNLSQRKTDRYLVLEILYNDLKMEMEQQKIVLIKLKNTITKLQYDYDKLKRQNKVLIGVTIGSLLLTVFGGLFFLFNKQ